MIDQKTYELEEVIIICRAPIVNTSSLRRRRFRHERRQPARGRGDGQREVRGGDGRPCGPKRSSLCSLPKDTARPKLSVCGLPAATLAKPLTEGGDTGHCSCISLAIAAPSDLAVGDAWGAASAARA